MEAIFSLSKPENLTILLKAKVELFPVTATFQSFSFSNSWTNILSGLRAVDVF